jgi:cell division protein FtsZ
VERNVTQIMKKAVTEKTIDDIAREAIPQISVMGVGGAGSNIVSWMKQKEAAGAKIYALNTDAKHLSICSADKRVLIGYRICGGLGCGGFPEQGAKAAEENADEIRNLMVGSGLVFITAGLGGGTGTGAAPVVADLAKEIGALTLGVVTVPFQVEKARMLKAKEGLKRLIDKCDAVVVIDNTRLRKVAGWLPLTEAFAVANELIAVFIKNISETIAVPSLVNLDFADLKSIMVGARVCAIGVGESMGEAKVDEAIEKALNTQLLDIGDVKKSEGALVHIEGGDDMTLEEINRAGELVINRISPTAKVSWGARINSKMEGAVRAIIVLAGVESPFLLSELPTASSFEAPIGKGLEAEIVKEPAEKEVKKAGFWKIRAK